jgi:F-type H+-transporting ATPase subunit b
MTALILLLEPDSGGQIQQIANTFGVDWPHLIAQIISFCIVCALLYRYAYKPVLTMLETRRQQIADGLADAEQMKTKLAETESQRQQILLQTDAHATKLIEEAREAAARVLEHETRKAIATGEHIVKKANEAAAQERARMLAELKREVGQLVVQTTAIVTRKILTAEDQRRMAEETANQLSAAA